MSGWADFSAVEKQRSNSSAGAIIHTIFSFISFDSIDFFERFGYNVSRIYEEELS